MKSSESTSTVSILFNKATAGIVIASSLLLSNVQVVNANNNYYDKATQEASKLFLQSEQALKETINNYKIVDSQWQYVHQLLNNNYKIIFKSSDVINMITNDLMKIESSINKLIQINNGNIMILQEEVTNSDSLTSTLYQQAKKSSEKNDKPSGKLVSLLVR